MTGVAAIVAFVCLGIFLHSEERTWFTTPILVAGVGALGLVLTEVCMDQGCLGPWIG
ncbi:MAG: hypothetical protein ACE5Q3_16920 [Alphaproteobacteria bacterium]